MNKRLPSPPPIIEHGAVALLAGLLVLVCASFYSLEIKWGELFTADAVNSSLEFLRGFAPPELAWPFLVRIAAGMLETLSMSAL